ncbi:MAG: HD-GYP domain-containing protein [Sulfurimonas sp.]|nr:HD-GYP domain-containing protein [Sulfurimonas sp.]
MISNKYLLMDRNIVSTGAVFDFNIFLPSNLNQEIKLFKEKNSIITSNDLMRLGAGKALYINTTEHENYLIHLDGVKKDAQNKDAKKSKEIESTSFTEMSAVVYTNATKTLEDLFNNPETLGNYENSKVVVSELVENILHDDFTLKSLMNIAEHDYYTHTHSLNVAVYAMSLGSFLKLDKKSLAELGESALLHDLGKSKISPDIINKNGKLTDKEFRKMMAHSTLGYSIGLKLGIDNNRILQGIKYHHEKMDGSGYPDGLLGNGIPIYARIIGLCDIFDALTSKRSYKDAMTTFDAIKLIKTQMSNHVDLKLLNSMLMMFR